MKSDMNSAERQPCGEERELPEASVESAQANGPAAVANLEPDALLENVTAERDALLDRVARIQAEFENFRKRNAKEREKFRECALADALKSLLPSLDSIDWALQVPTQDLDQFRSGVELIRRQLNDALGKVGLEQIPAKGEPFDPNLHEAIDTIETEDQDNQVVDELRRGYKLGSRLLRPSMVIVGRTSSKET